MVPFTFTFSFAFLNGGTVAEAASDSKSQKCEPLVSTFVHSVFETLKPVCRDVSTQSCHSTRKFGDPRGIQFIFQRLFNPFARYQRIIVDSGIVDAYTRHR